MAETTPTTTPRRLTDLLDSKFMARLDALDLFSRKILQGKLQGERRSKRRGEGAEFADHRPYVVGDDLRFVDWNIFGRLDQLFLKIFLVEQDLSVQIVLDTSASAGTGEPLKSRATLRLGAALAYVGLVETTPTTTPRRLTDLLDSKFMARLDALAYVGLVNNSRVTISTFADGLVGQLANMRGRNYLPRMADFLLNTESDGPSHFETACKQLAAGRIGTGLMIVVSDFLFKEGYEEALRRLVSRHYDLYCIQMLSPQELNPPLQGDLKLIDVEDLDDAEVTMSAALLEYYKKNLAAYCNELQAFCRRHGATYALTNSAEPVEPLMLNYLRRRGLLR
jgi:uncharacterized protein (DUF58 family)